MTRSVAILGATGSIGASTLAVVRAHRQRFRVVGLSANGRIDRLADLCAEFRPECAAVGDVRGADELRSILQARGVDTRVVWGAAGLVELATMPEADTVVAAIVGAAGLESGLAAARAGKRILLANKESLVMAGDVFMRAVREGGADLLPIDSEHNAIHQALPRGAGTDLARAGVRRIILTASGGPFRMTPPELLERVTPDEACAHPNWVMGRKISVDSATMMNKGLEVIEARWLFDALSEQIEVVIHPQSTVHSLVEYADGSLIAQLGQPDMRTPIAYALAYPDRIDSGVERLDLTRSGVLEFHPPDPVRFPCLRLAFEALKLGGSAPARLSAANEVAVEAFLAGAIGFTDIARLIEDVMGRTRVGPAATLAEVLAADAEARALAHAWVGERAGHAPRGKGYPHARGHAGTALAAGKLGR